MKQRGQETKGKALSQCLKKTQTFYHQKQKQSFTKGSRKMATWVSKILPPETRVANHFKYFTLSTQL